MDLVVEPTHSHLECSVSSEPVADVSEDVVLDIPATDGPTRILVDHRPLGLSQHDRKVVVGSAMVSGGLVGVVWASLAAFAVASTPVMAAAIAIWGAVFGMMVGGAVCRRWSYNVCRDNHYASLLVNEGIASRAAFLGGASAGAAVGGVAGTALGGIIAGPLGACLALYVCAPLGGSFGAAQGWVIARILSAKRRTQAVAVS